MSGFHSIGIDLNPVMKIIAKARQATISDAKVAVERLAPIELMKEGTIEMSGSEYSNFLNQVKAHYSKASRSYYYKKFSVFPGFKRIHW
uniref:Uncharacterized protein n=1 Tax=Candidatus Kentrum sp. MB TaxID=2138164 RepID=A0A450XCB7_9GAMM|nr:MAG: hypothetical protein BECKMB1821G_GA0114241_102414 [Candidatus Kentron sp. MB]VFK31179.1 MAG: hypothetical protein BECKMB1821I_GA0114274_102113 [Candidatus Kentron sp. MB]VFK75380.1 MAG: hypothetical protein BECKMB1821H_GA0114242_102114 [Candidatus Kentron sp. MB]